MAVNPIITNTKLTVKVGKETYYTNSNIDEMAGNDDIYSFAEAVNSLQHGVMDTVSKTVQYRMMV